jgi:hypothetical protein
MLTHSSVEILQKNQRDTYTISLPQRTKVRIKEAEAKENLSHSQSETTYVSVERRFTCL